MKAVAAHSFSLRATAGTAGPACRLVTARWIIEASIARRASVLIKEKRTRRALFGEFKEVSALLPAVFVMFWS